jgi:integrase
MPRLARAIPKYRKHRASGQAFVELSHRRFYLGRHGTRTSELEYDRLTGEWLRSGRLLRPTPEGPGPVLIVELAAAYLNFAKTYYQKNGQPTTEYASILHALKPLKRLYGRYHVDKFGPIALQTVMAAMVTDGWARTTVNRQAGRIKRMFRWGVAQELIPVSIYDALKSVEGLHKGRSDARETAPVLPVADDVVDATIPLLPEVVQDMVRLERLTGCRPSEICQIRPAEIDCQDDVWLYSPSEHKTQHRGRERIIFVGPRGQSILFKYLARDPQMHCFRPVDSEAKRRAAAHAARVTPLSCGDVPGSNRRRKPKRTPRDAYDVDSYRRAIARACDVAFPHPTLSSIPTSKLTPVQLGQLKKWQSAHRWAPNQLRHSAATEIRRRFGLEGAQIVLGHSKADTTQIYAEVDRQKGIEIARRIG